MSYPLLLIIYQFVFGVVGVDGFEPPTLCL